LAVQKDDAWVAAMVYEKEYEMAYRKVDVMVAS
jgi:hypothetical protein